MKLLSLRLVHAAFLAGIAIVPFTVAPTALRADDRKYHDNAHNDDHEWNANEDKAYRMWVKENHRKYNDFAKIKVEDQQSYWAWRHEHSDAVLKINIH
jgi:hypothetical protein